MHVQTLNLDVDYSLVGIHSTEEDYRLAFLLNKHLTFKLSRHRNSLDFEKSSAEFPIFEYHDEKNFVHYYLISNKHKTEVNNFENLGLFDGNYATPSYLIPEKKNVDFFLKIEGYTQENLIHNLVSKLTSLNQIITSYSIEPLTLKSRNHLIF